jgi:hypothetical protein
LRDAVNLKICDGSVDEGVLGIEDGAVTGADYADLSAVVDGTVDSQ